MQLCARARQHGPHCAEAGWEKGGWAKGGWAKGGWNTIWDTAGRPPTRCRTARCREAERRAGCDAGGVRPAERQRLATEMHDTSRIADCPAECARPCATRCLVVASAVARLQAAASPAATAAPGRSKARPQSSGLGRRPVRRFCVARPRHQCPDVHPHGSAATTFLRVGASSSPAAVRRFVPVIQRKLPPEAGLDGPEGFRSNVQRAGHGVPARSGNPDRDAAGVRGFVEDLQTTDPGGRRRRGQDLRTRSCRQRDRARRRGTGQPVAPCKERSVRSRPRSR